MAAEWFKILCSEPLTQEFKSSLATSQEKAQCVSVWLDLNSLVVIILTVIKQGYVNNLGEGQVNCTTSTSKCG